MKRKKKHEVEMICGMYAISNESNIRPYNIKVAKGGENFLRTLSPSLLN